MSWLTEKMIPAYLRIDPASVQKLIESHVSQFIEGTLQRTGKKGLCAVLGLSGGIDSATVLPILCLTVGNLRVYPVLMPGPTSSEASIELANAEITRLQVPVDHSAILRISHEDVVHAAGVEVEQGSALYGNIMARLRMIRLRNRVAMLQAEDPDHLYLLAGTENASEHWMGFFTIDGDSSSDLEILHFLYKVQVWQLAKHLGVDQRILDKDPSPELGDCDRDEDSLPAQYAKIDQVLYFLMKHGRTEQDVLSFLHNHSVDSLMALIYPLVTNYVSDEETRAILSWVKAKRFKLEIPYLIGGDFLFFQGSESWLNF